MRLDKAEDSGGKVQQCSLRMYFCQSCTSNADAGEGVSLTGNGGCI